MHPLQLKTIRTHCPDPDAPTRHVRSSALIRQDDLQMFGPAGFDLLRKRILLA